jgi:hypothetical protein
MGQQLNVQTKDPTPQGYMQYTLPLYTASNLTGYHLVVVMEDGHVMRQPFGLDAFFHSYDEFTRSGVLPHLIALLGIIYDIQPLGDETSVWASLEVNPDVVEREGHPTYWLQMNSEDNKYEPPWFIRLSYQTTPVARSVR